jgi:hypothetical protein
MKDAVKFRWEGSPEHESGLAVYEFNRSAYSLRLPNLRAASVVHIALSDAHRSGYESGVRSARVAVQSALSKLPEEAQ